MFLNDAFQETVSSSNKSPEQKFQPFKEKLSSIIESSDIPKDTLKLDTSCYPPKVICIPCKTKIKCNLTRNLEGLKKHLDRDKHINTIEDKKKKYQKKGRIYLKKRVHELFASIDAKHPQTFELCTQGSRNFLHCQVCMGTINVMPQRGQLNHNVETHLKSAEHSGKGNKSVKKQKSIFSFLKKPEDDPRAQD